MPSLRALRGLRVKNALVGFDGLGLFRVFRVFRGSPGLGSGRFFLRLLCLFAATPDWLGFSRGVPKDSGAGGAWPACIPAALNPWG